VRAGNSSRLARKRKRQSHALLEDSSPIEAQPRPARLTSAEKAARAAVLKNSLIGKAPAFEARARGQGGLQPRRLPQLEPHQRPPPGGWDVGGMRRGSPPIGGSPVHGTRGQNRPTRWSKSASLLVKRVWPSCDVS
jgi:hypothetical protein